MSHENNDEKTEPRVYRQKFRAKQQEETRQRIVESAVALHESVGGEQATVTKIADRAGVSRITVYRHFPDEQSLLQACTQHYLGANPPPGLSSWMSFTEGKERLRAALTEIYGYHRRTERMMDRAFADSVSNEILAGLLQPYFEFWNHVRDTLAAAWDGAPVAPIIGHSIDFRTWKTLVREQGMPEEQAIELFVDLVESEASHAHLAINSLASANV
jgi:AcrR family transcriptional regulator